MEFFQGSNLFYYVILFCGLGIIFNGFKSYWQQGVSAESSMTRFLSVLIPAAIAGIITFTLSNPEDIHESLFFIIMPLAISLFIFLRKLKHLEVTIKKYIPNEFFSILENNLEKNGYEYVKSQKGEDEFISSNVTTYYEIPKTNEKIKVDWRDLDLCDMKLVFQNFYDKDLVKEIIRDLKEKSSHVSFFQQTKYQWLFGIAFIWFSVMKLIGY
ncbi:hypothetical protein [Sutcliffiella halmapala]|uniref:hypothetical protein n=1 Tax=Sutcliffiella halmapala TaxID=79882 RepID=UPI000994EA2A|nr:hypothetical protein [Sutcliffiella halmapala]